MRTAGSIGSLAMCGVLLYALPTAAQTAAEIGPTVDSRSETARELIGVRPTYDPGILSRHADFQRDMALAFGIPVVGAAYGPGMRVGFVDDMSRWMAARWGDSVFNEWAQGMLLTYARMEESATIRAKGFDMAVDVDDVAQGRFGIRVNRALE